MISTLFQYTANTAQKMHSWKKNCHAKVIDLESDRSSSTAHVVYRKKNESIIALWRWASIYRPQSELLSSYPPPPLLNTYVVPMLYLHRIRFDLRRRESIFTSRCSCTFCLSSFHFASFSSFIYGGRFLRSRCHLRTPFQVRVSTARRASVYYLQ